VKYESLKIDLVQVSGFCYKVLRFEADQANISTWDWFFEKYASHTKELSKSFRFMPGCFFVGCKWKSLNVLLRIVVKTWMFWVVCRPPDSRPQSSRETNLQKRKVSQETRKGHQSALRRPAPRQARANSHFPLNGSYFWDFLRNLCHPPYSSLSPLSLPLPRSKIVFGDGLKPFAFID